MFDITGKCIVVTGGNGLLGKKIVERLRSAGAIVISGDIQPDMTDPLSRVLDITDETSVTRFVQETVAEFKRIDGWINNAYPRTSDWGNKVEDIVFESWRRNVDMHLNGYFISCKIALEQMKKQGSGSLINMSSIYGAVGPDFTVYEGTDITMPAAYAAIKGGINTLTRYLSAYYGPYNIRVNAISPGGIFDEQAERFVENYNKKVPLRRMGTPEDISSSVHFLLSDDAGYITGHNLMVDGGWTAI